MVGSTRRHYFMGQSVKYSGNAIYNTLSTLDDSKKIETTVFEEIQVGMSVGMKLEGHIPISCFPRFDFFNETNGFFGKSP